MTEKKKRSTAGKILKAILILILVLVLIAGAYIAYVLIDYHRIDDNLELEILGNGEGMPVSGKEYTMISYNIGFAAYTADFGFFMDGGTESRARSEESVYSVLGGVTNLLCSCDPDFAVIEEVDFDSDRSWHVDERAVLADALGSYSRTFAQNYDSPYLFYPFTCPHGASKSGIMTFSRFPITSSLRRSLPVETSLMKLVDLDRCYSVSRIPTENGNELVVFSAHLSAYTSDGTLPNRQLELLLADMQLEYDKGNYVICAGDFNKDLLGSGSEIFNVTNEKYTWAQPLPDGIFDGTNLSLAAPFDEKNPIPSCRNADSAYHKGQYVITPDGFIVSDNITVLSSAVIDTGFEFSDHNPVIMKFILD